MKIPMREDWVIGLEEEDWVIGEAGAMTCKMAVWVHGRPGARWVFSDFDEAAEFVKNRRDEEEFWPNVWSLDDHGGLTLLYLCPECGGFTGNPSGYHYECSAESGELRAWERRHEG